VQPGEYVNSAQAFNNWCRRRLERGVECATATVRVIPDPLFECSDLIGKVFDDRNANGYRTTATRIPNVRWPPRALAGDHRRDGRFHVACPAIPDAERAATS